jgi:hypothetical protein
MTNLELITDVLTNAGWDKSLVEQVLYQLANPRIQAPEVLSSMVLARIQKALHAPINMKYVHSWLHWAVGLMVKGILSNGSEAGMGGVITMMTNVNDWLDSNPI